MNQFSQHSKNTQGKIQRIKIKSKYFGQYQPQLFIASRSKSKSNSTSKDHLNNKFSLKYQDGKQPKINQQNYQNRAKQYMINTVNPQAAKSPKSYNSGSLSEYLLSRSASPGRKKQRSAIQKIIDWVQRKYNENIINQKIEKGTSLYALERTKNLNKNSNQKFQESFKKFAYNVYILKRLKGQKFLQHKSSSIKIRFEEKKIDLKKSNETKQHDIDNFAKTYIKQIQKVQDFGIYKFKNNQIYGTENNVYPVHDISIEPINGSGIKNNLYETSAQRYNQLNKQKYTQIPTMNTFQSINQNNKEKNQLKKKINALSPVSQNKYFFVQTARSTSTNQIQEISKTSLFQNSSEKQKLIQNHQMMKNLPISDKDLKKSITIEESQDSQQNRKYKYQENSIQPNLYETKQYLSQPLSIELKGSKHIDIKIANHLTLALKKKLKNQTNLCDTDYQPNSLFHPEKLQNVLFPIEINTLNSFNEPSQQILTEIFQMNDNHQQIIKMLKSKNFSSNNQFKINTSQNINNFQILHKKNQNTQLIKQINTNKQSRKKYVAENYFSQHLQVNNFQQAQIKTFQMPLIKANTQIGLKARENHPKINNLNSYASKNLLQQQNQINQKEVFTFNSLNPQIKGKQENTKLKISFQNHKQQNNAFVQKCNIFGSCCPKTVEQLERSNYFTDNSTSARQRGTSCNSNQSKTSSKPKVNFNYVSPSSKNIPILEKARQHQNSVLFKTESSYLKNSGSAPVKIQIKASRQTKKQNMKIQNQIIFKNKQTVFPAQINKQIKSQPLIDQKQRSQSVPQFAVKKSEQQLRPKEKQIQIVSTQKNIQTKNAFINTGYTSNYYYQSQKVIPTLQPQHPITETLYQSVQSYYFPIPPSSNANNQIPYRVQPLVQISSPVKQMKIQHNQKDFANNNGQRYLYPIQNSVQKQRSQRARSLNEKIFVTVKKNKV